MKKFKFFVILMCLSLCFGGMAYAAQAQRTNDGDLVIHMNPYNPHKDSDRSGNVLVVTGTISQNPLCLTLSLPERLGTTMITVKDTQTNAILGSITVNTIQESIVNFNFERGSGHFNLTIESADYVGEGEFTL